MSWLIAGILLFILMVMAEKAIVAVTPHELEMLRAEGTPSARRVVMAADSESRRTLAAIAMARLFLIVFSSFVLFRLIWNHDFWHELLETVHPQHKYLPFMRWAVVLLGVSILSFVFWKTSQISLRRTQRPIAGFWLLRLSGLIFVSRILFKPFLPTKEKTLDLIPPTTPDGIAPTITVQQAATKRDIELLKSIAKFGDVTVRQVMQPQPKITAVEVTMGFDEVLTIIRESEFSRIPVYEDDMDNMTGVLYVKDLVAAIDFGPDYNWVQKVRNAVFIVPETKPISELLREFQERKLHLALVVDEYGGTCGLVTLEDILEEVTGEIRDEFDEENEIPPYRQLDDHNYLFSGATMINDVCEITGIDPETFEEVREDADTIAGLALTLIGDIPKPGDQIAWGQYTLTIEKADNRRIEEIRLTINT